MCNSMQTKTNLNSKLDLNSAVCYPRIIFIIVMIIVSTVILARLLYGLTWLRKPRNLKMYGVSEKVSNLLRKLIKLNSSSERPSHKTFKLLVTLMHLLKDESLSNKNIFNVLKKISKNKNKSFKLWKENNGLHNVSNAKSVLDQLSLIDPYVNLIKHLRNFNYSQVKESHKTPTSNIPQISKPEKRPKSKVRKVSQFDIKKTKFSQKVLKTIHTFYSHINDSNQGNTIIISAQNNTTKKAIDSQFVNLQKTSPTPKVFLSSTLKSNLYESNMSPMHKSEDNLSIKHGNRKEGSVILPSWLISSASIIDSWTANCIDEAREFSDGEEEHLDIETYIPFNKTAFNIIFLSHPSMFPIAAAARILKLFLQVTLFLAVTFLLLIIIAFAEVREVHGYLYVKDRIAGMDTFQSLISVFGPTQEAARKSISLNLQTPASSCSSLVSLRSVLEREDTLLKHEDRTWRDRMLFAGR